MSDESLDNKEVLESADNFEKAYKEHADSIYRFLFWRTKNTQVSEDLTSTTFEKAWINRKSFKGGSTKAWLYRIARNNLIDYWRKSSDVAIDTVAEKPDESSYSLDEALDKKLQIKTMKKAVSRLPEDMRSVVNLRFIEGLSCQQVADKLNLTEGNVRVIQYRALKKLRDYLK